MTEKGILDQSRESEHGVVHMIAGRPVHLPKLDALDLASEPVVRFGAALDIINETHEAITKIKSDKVLSDFGKDQKLEPLREALIGRVASQIEEIDKFAEAVDRREAALLAVPKIEPQNAAEALVDRELRDWWKEQSSGVRMDLLQKMNEEPGHERLEIALLRSPYAQVDREVALAREAWNNAKRLENPAEAQAIAMWRNQNEWATRAFAHFPPITTILSELPRDRVLGVLLSHGKSNKTIQAFGFDSHTIERSKLLAKQRASSVGR
ncbi:hypothetical protein [Pseudomonas sp. dw_358]|uniref:hypothetical protein n=1 Tax=Pseudomonas sp. dw_358 TaxID=2720083 RepID=UPI001BD33C91|nr:hypothetical protein [Pseudomonas sp. dw_358]